MTDPMRSEEVPLRDGRHVSIRPGTISDAEAILDNINLVCKEEVYILMDEVAWDLQREEEWLSDFDGDRNALFVAADGETIVGQVDCHGGRHSKDRHTGLIGIVIREGWREAGLGRTLMSRILEWMRSRGFKKALLSVFSTNRRARRLYESLGFREEGVRSRMYVIRGEYVDDVTMELWLGD